MSTSGLSIKISRGSRLSIFKMSWISNLNIFIYLCSVIKLLKPGALLNILMNYSEEMFLVNVKSALEQDTAEFLNVLNKEEMNMMQLTKLSVHLP
jgi:hypothetical protein